MADVTIVNSIHAHNPRIPLGPLYLCAVLEANGYEVDFRDYQVCDDEGVGSADQFAAWLEGAAPILAVSALSSSLPLVLAALGRRRLRDSVETVVLGGAGVNGLGSQILTAAPAVDAVATGEGEMTLLELVRRAGNGLPLAGIPGLSCRDGSRVHVGPQRPRMVDLDALPFPAYHHVDVQKYAQSMTFNISPQAVLSSRGCPYSCSFCDIPGIWRGGIRFRSVANVLDEIAFLKKRYALPRFHVADDTFVLEPKRVLEFCSGLADRGLVMSWSCLGRVDRIDGGLLDRLAEAGCDTIFYGIEAGNNEMLRRIGKGFRIEQAVETVKLSMERMNTHVSFIWGFPFESLDDLCDTVVVLLEMRGMGAEPRLNLLAPLPSARLGGEPDSRLLPLLSAEIGWEWMMKENYPVDEELRAFVRTHRDICMPFYCLDSPDFDRKVRLLESWGLGLGRATPETRPDADRSAAQGLSGEAAGKPFDPRDGRPLPGVSGQVSLHTVGGRQLLFDRRGCLLYQPLALSIELFCACRRREDSGAFVARLSQATGESTARASDFVRTALATFAQRDFLED